MKQLWVLNHYAVPPAEAGGTRHHGLATHLRSLGWDTTIIAASVQKDSMPSRLADHERFRTCEYDGVTYLWLRSPEYAGNGWARIRNMLHYAWRALLPSTTRDLPPPDAIIGSSVHPFAGVAGALLARRHHVPFIFEVRDLWPQTLIDLGRLKASHPIAWALRRLERWLYFRADRIITVLPRAGEYMAKMGVPSSKVHWLPNGVELHGYPHPENRPNGVVFSLLYVGAHGQANDLETVVRAMAELKHDARAKHIRLTMVGDGPLKSHVQTLALSLGADNIQFQASVPKSQIPEVTANADAFVLTVLDRPDLYRYGISMNKMFDYLAAGRPVIVACGVEDNAVTEAKGGLTVAPEDPKALAAAIMDLASSTVDQRASMGRSGREYVAAHHSYEGLAAQLAEILDELSGPGRRGVRMGRRCSAIRTGLGNTTT